MGMKRKLLALGASALAIGGLGSASANDRCGGALGIDAPTTLREIARRCNVSLRGLREANPSVDPRYVTPGTYVAIPDEKIRYANNAPDPKPDPVAPLPQPVPNPVTPLPQPVPDNPYDDGSYHEANYSTTARLTDLERDSRDPVWLAEVTGGGQRYASLDRLSYQQRSALRIHNAGVPIFDRPSFRPVGAVQGEPGAQLIACNVLQQKAADGKLHKLSKIISTPTNTFVEVEPAAEGGFDCTLVTAASVATTPGVPAAHYGFAPRVKPQGSQDEKYRVPSYDAIKPGYAAEADKFSISGQIIAEEAGCLILESENGGLWSLAAAPGAQALMGKQVTAWGVASRSGVCGSGPTMLVSHAVYAEPW